jgi:hypothetical protein
MANSINWGKTYCEIETNSGFGKDEEYTTFYIPDTSAPSCWSLVPVTPLTADMTTYLGLAFTADNAILTADRTQL